MTRVNDIRAQMEAMHALLKAEQEKTALAQREAELARQEASRMRDEIVAIPAEPSGSGSSAAAVNAQQPQQPLIILQACRFEHLREWPKKSGDPEVAEWVADMRYHLACNRMPKTTACALIMEHLKGEAGIEISGKDIRDDSEAIFRALLHAFGDGSDLASLQEHLCSGLLIEAGRYVQQDHRTKSSVRVKERPDLEREVGSGGDRPQCVQGDSPAYP